LHKHWCDEYGHDYECSENCDCICGLPMEGNDHSGCPIELRPCPEHKAEQERRMVEAMSSDTDAVSESTCDEQKPLPYCQCGCADADRGGVVGYCFWCDHVYVNYCLETEDQHFAYHCPEPPEKLKQAALASLAKRRA